MSSIKSINIVETGDLEVIIKGSGATKILMIIYILVLFFIIQPFIFWALPWTGITLTILFCTSWFAKQSTKVLISNNTIGLRRRIFPFKDRARLFPITVQSFVSLKKSYSNEIDIGAIVEYENEHSLILIGSISLKQPVDKTLDALNKYSRLNKVDTHGFEELTYFTKLDDYTIFNIKIKSSQSKKQLQIIQNPIGKGFGIAMFYFLAVPIMGFLSLLIYTTIIGLQTNNLEMAFTGIFLTLAVGIFPLPFIPGLCLLLHEISPKRIEVDSEKGLIKYGKWMKFVPFKFYTTKKKNLLDLQSLVQKNDYFRLKNDEMPLFAISELSYKLKEGISDKNIIKTLLITRNFWEHVFLKQFSQNELESHAIQVQNETEEHNVKWLYDQLWYTY
ncbi:MAG: hypothetical protein ACW981_05595 [Candidatus Hodarchaeales archaeon]|jgi:hypothetical protein